MDPLGKVPGGSLLVGLACAQMGPVAGMARDARGHRAEHFSVWLERKSTARNKVRYVRDV